MGFVSLLELATRRPLTILELTSLSLSFVLCSFPVRIVPETQPSKCSSSSTIATLTFPFSLFTFVAPVSLPFLSFSTQTDCLLFIVC